MFDDKSLARFRVAPGKKVRLKDHDPAWAPDDVSKADAKAAGERSLAESLKQLAASQELLYADDRYSLLVIVQAMDAAGKDGLVKHVMSGVNPQGCQVFSFKKPSDEELDHNFLWRCMARLPERGRIGIFNRSYYEETLVVRVHPELLDGQKLPPGKRDDAFWAARFEDINAFEKHLVRNGTIVLKFFLNVSKAEQKKRFLERLDEPHKWWKFSPADVAERQHWDAYQRAYEETIQATSTADAPWHIVPADRKWVTRAVVAGVLASTIRSLDLRYPELDAKKKALWEDARRKLVEE